MTTTHSSILFSMDIDDLEDLVDTLGWTLFCDASKLRDEQHEQHELVVGWHTQTKAQLAYWLVDHEAIGCGF